MAGSFHIEPASGCVLSRGWGVLSDADLLGHVRALAAHPAFAPTLRQCVDYLCVERAEVSSAAVRAAASLNPFAPGARRVFVLKRKVMLGLVRMYEMSGLLEDGAVVIVESLDDAGPALGLEGPLRWPSRPPDWVSDLNARP